MPVNPERRMLIADTAIEILSADGAGRLTHRAVDTRAGLPAGTTSNFFRTRLALLEAAARRLAEQHWLWVYELRLQIPENDRAGVAVLLSRMLESPDEAARNRSLARLELFLEGIRRPELRSFLEDIHRAAMQGAAVVLSSGGVSTTPERVRLLSRLLNGLLFDQLVLPDNPLKPDETTGLIERLLDLVFSD